MLFAADHSIDIGVVLVNLVIIAFLLLVIKGNRNNQANLLLSLFCLNYATITAYDLLVSKQIDNRYPILMKADTLLLLRLGPLFYLYVIAMTAITFKFQIKHLFHLLPVFVYLVYLIPFKLQAVSTQLVQFHGWQNNRHSAPLMMIYFSKSVVFIYLVLAYWLISKHQRVVGEILANIDGNNLQWIKRLIIILMRLFVVWILNNEVWLARGLYFDIFQMVFTYWLGYYVINQKTVYTNVADTASLRTLSEEQKIRYRNSVMTEAIRQALVDGIGQHMIDGRPYLNKDLTLTMLADQIGGVYGETIRKE
jgi:hypothetical protein